MEPATKTNTRTEQILTVMRILAWGVVIGLIFEVGGILISYGLSFANPVASRNLYRGLDLYSLRDFSFQHYSISIFFRIALLCMKAYVSFLVIKALSRVNLLNPFKIEVARILERVSYFLIGMAVIALLNNIHTAWLFEKSGIQYEDLSLGEYLFMAGLVFIISKIFKRGVEIQSENELTV